MFLSICSVKEKRGGTMPRTLKGLRADLGMTQEEAAKLIGVSVGTYVRYEKGKSLIPYRYVAIIAKKCGIKNIQEIKA